MRVLGGVWKCVVGLSSLICELSVSVAVSGNWTEAGLGFEALSAAFCDARLTLAARISGAHLALQWRRGEDRF